MPMTSELIVKEEIVMTFWKGGDRVAFEAKDEGGKGHRYTLKDSNWSDTVSLFDARK